jgi:hypothetical protein
MIEAYPCIYKRHLETLRFLIHEWVVRSIKCNEFSTTNVYKTISLRLMDLTPHSYPCVLCLLNKYLCHGISLLIRRLLIIFLFNDHFSTTCSRMDWSTGKPVDGRAIAQAVSRRLPTAAARVQTRVGTWDFVMYKSGAGAGFLRELRFPLSIYIPSCSPQSSSLSPEAGTIGQEWPQCL